MGALHRDWRSDASEDGPTCVEVHTETRSTPQQNDRRDCVLTINLALGAKWEALSQLVLGDELGAGYSRRTYANNLDGSTVIKFEENSETFQNVNEWHVWNELQHSELAKYLAPCVAISPCGRALVQRRADPVPTDYKFPEKVPEFLADLKRSNFGIIKRRLVAIDYGFVNATYSGTMRKARFGDY